MSTICQICYKSCVYNHLRLQCGHLLHKECFIKYLNFETFIKDSEIIRCPTCKTHLDQLHTPQQPYEDTHSVIIPCNHSPRDNLISFIMSFLKVIGFTNNAS